MSQETKKTDSSKLKDLASLDVKDIGKIFKKDKSNDLKGNRFEKKSKPNKKSRAVISIDLGSNSIKVAEGKLQKNILNINKLMEVKTPENTVDDGKILDQNYIVAILDKLIKENNIKAKDVIFTTNSSSVINRDILIPSVADEELDTVVKYEIQQYLPINLNDYVIQYVFLEEVLSENKETKLKINVTAFPERMALSYYNVINSLSLNPYILDVNYNSINKLANFGEFTLNNKNTIEGTVAFVDMGATSINVSIFKDGKIDFTRMIKIGGDNIDFALSESMNMSIKSTEFIKMKEVDLLDNDEGNIKTKTIQKVVDEVLEELERIIQFYRNKSNSSIDKLYVFGGLSRFKNMDIYLGEKLNIKSSKINEIKNVNLGNDALFTKDLSLYLNAIGAIIRV